jgi:hypothetical protein
LKKYVDVDHALIAKRFKEEVNNKMKSSMETYPTKKRPTISGSVISNLFGAKDPSKKIFFRKIFFAKCFFGKT